MNHGHDDGAESLIALHVNYRTRMFLTDNLAARWFWL